MKIVKQNTNKKIQPIFLKKNVNHIGLTRYFPSFSKEWKNIIYSYNNNILKNIPLNYFNLNKLIRGYFNLYFKNSQFIKDKYNIYLRKRRKFLKRIFISNAEIKYTNNKAIITLYTINKEKKALEKKYKTLNRILRKKLVKRFIKIYKSLPSKLNYLLTKRLNKKYLYFKNISKKNNIIMYKFNFLTKFTKLNNFYIKKLWITIEKKYLERRMKINKSIFSRTKTYSNIKWYTLLLRRYQLLYTLNQYKFNKSNYLPLLSNILNKVTGKKIEYNIVNLKSITHSSDIFTFLLSLKIKKRKVSNTLGNISPILHNSYLLNKKNTMDKKVLSLNTENHEHLAHEIGKYKDFKIISSLDILDKKKNLDSLLDNIYVKKNTYNTIYNNIKYKNIGGIKLEVNGRLTKRYRADRAKSFIRIKGGFKNKNSFEKKISTYLFKGNTKSNQSYSFYSSKRRIGSFAVKGWISGK